MKRRLAPFSPAIYDVTFNCFSNCGTSFRLRRFYVCGIRPSCKSMPLLPTARGGYLLAMGNGQSRRVKVPGRYRQVAGTDLHGNRGKAAIRKVVGMEVPLMHLSFAPHPGERIRWQACPAPRAYVFRRWRLSLGCLPVWLGVCLWFASDLYSGEPVSVGWFVWRAVLCLLLGYGTVGHLFVARLLWRWERYLLTDHRVCINGGLFGRRKEQFSLGEVEILRVIPLSGSLATVQLRSRVTGAVSTLYCLEGASVFVGFFATGIGGETR